jgi:hypothetical protein
MEKSGEYVDLDAAERKAASEDRHDGKLRYY